MLQTCDFPVIKSKDGEQDSYIATHAKLKKFSNSISFCQFTYETSKY